MPRSHPSLSRTGHVATISLLVLAVMACTAAPGRPVDPPAATEATGAPTTPAAVVPLPAPTAQGDLVAIRVGADPASRRVQLVDAATGVATVDLPDGVVDQEAGLVYVAATAAGMTDVTAYELATGEVRASTTLAGRLSMPMIGADADPVGLSGDGGTLALDVGPELLAKAGPGNGTGGSGVTRFAILATDLASEPEMVELPGRWSFDALSPDGAILYLVEHLTTSKQAEYQVRAYDVVTGVLRDAVVVDKRAGSLLMDGTPVAQATTRAGEWVYTLYRNREVGPFVHALQAREVWALCIFPTKRPTPADEQRAATGWDLVLSEDAGSLYAANGALGMVTRIPVADPVAAQTVTFRGAGGPGSTARGAALSADARSLHVASGGNVVQLDAASLVEGGRFAGSGGVAALVARPAGGLYATLRTGRLAVLGTSAPGDGVALTGGPARILWVEARR